MSEAVVHAPARGGLAARMPVIGVLAAVAVLAFVASLLVGPAGIGFPGGGDAARVIFWEIRLPRAVLGALVGGALGLSGAVLQGYLRNPLAEPGLLGVSGGAALGAVSRSIPARREHSLSRFLLGASSVRRSQRWR